MSVMLPGDSWTGDYLVEHGHISEEQLIEAIGLAGSWNVPLSDVLMARNFLRPILYYRTLAQRYGMDFVDLRAEPPQIELLTEADVDDYARELVIPWRRENGRLVVATANPGPQALLFARCRWGSEIKLVLTAKFDILWSLQTAFGQSHSDRAVWDLARRDPEMSASAVVTRPQIVFVWAALTAFAAGLCFAPVGTLIVVSALMSVLYLGNFVLKALLVWFGAGGLRAEADDLAARAKRLDDEQLPTFTVLVPMFREPEVLPILANALRKLDYPQGKLDIKLVLEEGDDATINAAKELGLEGIFEIVRVPQSHPQTKPKACNYALRYARGDYLVIYDAEDKPEPDQLKKVVAAFQMAPDNIACVQCRLNYFNANENWLTRMFTLDYSLWFDLMLPGLQKLGIPIPLGGTSNHFKIDVLRELYAWDPFNVTEDADLGIRMTQKGYGVKVIDSTTFEEANVSQGNWVRQRSRWIKGYMQTFLVHTRRPLQLFRQTGPLGALGFIFFIGGTMLSGVLNPLFWAIFGFWAVTKTSAFDMIFPPALLYLSLFNLIAGNGLFVYLMMIAPFRRRWLHISPYGLTVAWYWVLISVAAWKALGQLVTNPFYWEKTHHGLSKFTAAEVAEALEEQGGPA